MKQKFPFLICLISLFICNPNIQVKGETSTSHIYLERAQIALDSLNRHYTVKGSNLLRETFPFDEKYTATYLASESKNAPNPYSYLWPYSGTFSAVSALNEASNLNRTYSEMLDKKVLPGLEVYFDKSRKPFSYSSYINTSSPSDRFYDDNVWIGIDFTDSYLLSGKKSYLKKAEIVWKFIESGTDEKLGGGIYWCEQKKNSKNTCSNAPGSVFALKLFLATKDSLYFQKGKKLYEWTKSNLQDSTDNLYYDNISLRGRIGKAKFAYNSGQMLQAASLLYKITEDKSYLIDAQAIAKSCYGFFFENFTRARSVTRNTIPQVFP